MPDDPISAQVTTVPANGAGPARDDYDPVEGEKHAQYIWSLLEHEQAMRKKQTRETDWENDWRFIDGNQWDGPAPSYRRQIVMNAWRRCGHIVIATVTGGRPTVKILPGQQPPGSLPPLAIEKWQNALWAALRRQKVMEQCLIDALFWALYGDGGWFKIGFGRWAAIDTEQPDVLVTSPHPKSVYPDSECTDISLAQCHHIGFKQTLDLSTVTDRYPQRGWRAKPDGDVSTKWPREAPPWLTTDTITPSGGWRMTKNYRRARAEVVEWWTDDSSIIFEERDVLVGMDRVTMHPEIRKERVPVRLYPYGRVITCTRDVILRDIPNPFGEALGHDMRWPFVFFPGALKAHTLWRPGLLSNKSETQRAINRSLSILLENYIKVTNAFMVADEQAFEDEDWDLISLVPGAKFRKRQGTEFKVIFPQALPDHAFKFPDYMVRKMEEDVGIHDPPLAPGQAVASKTVAFMQQKSSFMLGAVAKMSDESLERLGMRMLAIMRDRYVPGQRIPFFESQEIQATPDLMELPGLPKGLQLRVEATSAYAEMMATAQMMAQAAAQAQEDGKRSRS